jgi:hypothetical protein
MIKRDLNVVPVLSAEYLGGVETIGEVELLINLRYSRRDKTI